MSSYNENLNASVAVSLQAQELKLSTTQSQLNAGMFTLYYAEDAKVTAQEKLKGTEKKYSDQKKIKEEAVADNNSSTNLLVTANKEKQFNLQSVSNTAVAAANVQIATNAILKLASDMGSIVSILNAADFDSQIYKQAASINKFMNETAYVAEVTSQWAMEASSLTAEVTSSTVADMATTTATAITNLLTVLNSQLEATTLLQSTENADLANAATTQRKAEGDLKNNQVEYEAAKETYSSCNKELNLNLTIVDKSNTGFTLQFKPYSNPFFGDPENVDNILSKVYKTPVESYYAFIVKESEKSTFSLTIAEGLIGNEQIAIEIKNNKLYQDKIFQKITINEKSADNKNFKYLDTNGESIKLGVNYVVFVMVQFTLDYKKTLNVFEDFLTASSSQLILTNQLNSPAGRVINVNSKNEELTLEFEVTGNNVFNDAKINYRCMFLPDNSEFIHADFITEDLAYMDRQIMLKKNTDTYLLETLNTQLKKLKSEKSKLEKELKKDTEELSHDIKELDDVVKKNNTDTTELIHDINDLNNEVNELEIEIDLLNDEIFDLEIDIENLGDNIKNLKDLEASFKESEIKETIILNNDNKTQKPGFIFNQLIAENVVDGNYTVPVGDEIKEENDKTSVTLKILDNATDNFGNPLVEGNQYVPVILSVATGPKSKTVQYSNSLSNFQKTKSFKYLPKKN